MGCDIHLVVEVLRGGSWHAVKASEVPGLKEHYATRCYEPGDVSLLTYNGRNYSLFAILADVRNDGNIVPFADPRGAPENPSAEYIAEVESYGADGHSESWFTLAELQAAPFATETTHTGIVDAGIYREWFDAGAKSAPKVYSKGVGGGNVRVVDRAAMDRLLATDAIMLTWQPTKSSWDSNYKITSRDGYSYYTRVEWQETYSESAGDFVNFMAILATLGAPDAVRVCFFFDN